MLSSSFLAKGPGHADLFLYYNQVYLDYMPCISLSLVWLEEEQTFNHIPDILGENYLSLPFGFGITGPLVVCVWYSHRLVWHLCCSLRPWRFHSSTINAVSPASVQLYSLQTEDSAFIFIWSRTRTMFNSANYSWKIFIYFQPFQWNSPTLNLADQFEDTYSSSAFSANFASIHPGTIRLEVLSLISNCSCDSCQHFWLDFFQLEDFPFTSNLETWYFRLPFHFYFC